MSKPYSIALSLFLYSTAAPFLTAAVHADEQTAPLQGNAHQPLLQGEAKETEVRAQTGASSKPLKLYGKLEEVCSGAALNVAEVRSARLKAMKGELDNSVPLRGSVKFPALMAGTYEGNLKISSADFFKPGTAMNPREEANERRLLKAGKVGHTFLQFLAYRKSADLRPMHLDFTESLANSQYASVFKQMVGSAKSPGSQAQFAQGLAAAEALLQRENYSFALHFGDLSSGRGVVGNEMYGEPLRSTVKQLAPNVFEKDILSYTVDRLPGSGTEYQRYSQTVIRVTDLGHGRLYIEAALVNYDTQGRMVDRVVVYGNVNKVAQMPALPGAEQVLN